MRCTRDMVWADPRRGGAVLRYHCWPTIQQQTVAESSWNVARILVMIWPDAPAQAVTHALLNDCGELRSGDLPFPVKRDNPVLKSEVSRIEFQSLEEQGIAALADGDLLHQLGGPWKSRVKICDMLEMWEFGLEELALGNLYAEPIVEGTITSVSKLIRQFGLNENDYSAVMRYREWRCKKTPSRG